MEDIDKELGALLDQYNNKFEGSVENHKRLEENQDIKNAFNDLVENVIQPGLFKSTVEQFNHCNYLLNFTRSPAEGLDVF